MDNLSVTNVLYSLIKNILFLLSAWGIIALVISLLVKEPAERKTGVRAAGVVVVVMAFAWFWAVAELGLPAFDQVIDNALAQITTISKTSATTITSPSNPSAPSPSAPPSPSVAPTAPTAGTSNHPEQDSIFDLGSHPIAGHFSDGVAYWLYTIQPGDTVYNIRHRFGLTEEEICRRNDIDIRRHIIAGRQLKISLPLD